MILKFDEDKSWIGCLNLQFFLGVNSHFDFGKPSFHKCLSGRAISRWRFTTFLISNTVNNSAFNIETDWRPWGNNRSELLIPLSSGVEIRRRQYGVNKQRKSSRTNNCLAPKGHSLHLQCIKDKSRLVIAAILYSSLNGLNCFSLIFTCHIQASASCCLFLFLFLFSKSTNSGKFPMWPDSI